MIEQSQILKPSSGDVLSPLTTAISVFTSTEAFIELIVEKTERSDRTWHVQPSAGLHQPWIRVMRPDVKPPRQGWKLHVTATVFDAPEILERSLEVLLMATCCFKVAGSLALLDHLNQGVGGATQVGKFITVYPFDDSDAVHLAEALDAATRDRGLHGPAVPSDRPIASGSLVSYRFGSFGEDLMQTPIGEMVPALLTPDGNWVPDRRTVGFDPPGWAEDPFIEAGLVRRTSSQERIRLVAERYLPLAMLYSSPRGDVSLATDLVEGRVCVLKSAHPHAVVGPDGRDARDRLRYEAGVLAQLSQLAPVPTPLSLVEDDGELYLALEDMGGETLETRVLALTAQGRLTEPAQVLAWGQQLADVLTTLHDAGFVYGDLKSINVLERPGGGLCLVDVEGAEHIGSNEAASRSGTRGYRSPERGVHGSPTVDDDVHGLGAVLYFLATGAEPSLAARPEQLLSRPVELLNPRIATPLARVISRCLAPVSDTNRLHTPAEVSAALAAVSEPATDPPPYGEGPTVDWDHCHMDKWREMAGQLGNTLCAVAVPTPGGCLGWASIHSTGAGLRTRDINTGNAGTVLALAEVVAAHRDPLHREMLFQGAGWLRAIPRPKGRPLTGLYLGEGGVAVALLRAGQVLGDMDLLEEAAARGRWMATQPLVAPDLMNGAAGRLRAQLLLWDEFGDDAHLRDAIAAGQWLLAHAESVEQGLRWRIPDGFGVLSGRVPVGYAHGAAGIGDALLDLAGASGDERFISAAQGVTSWLEASARPSTENHLDWPDIEGGDISAPFWCRGATGVGRFFLHAAAHGSPGAIDVAGAAARSAARGARWASPTQCHGLAGNIEFLLDLYQATGDPAYRAEAARLAQLLEGWSVRWQSSLCWPSENGRTFSPDYMVGYAGVMVCLLRLSDPERRPHQLTRAGFRFRPIEDPEDRLATAGSAIGV